MFIMNRKQVTKTIKAKINIILYKIFISVNNNKYNITLISDPIISQIDSKYFDQNLVLYSLISEYNESNERIIFLIIFLFENLLFLINFKIFLFNFLTLILI